MKGLWSVISIALSAISVFIFGSTASTAGQGGALSGSSEGFDYKASAERLARAVQFQTISYEDRARFNQNAFTGFHEFLEREFPKVHSSLKKEVIGDYSLLYTWPGSDNREWPILLAAHMDVVPDGSESGIPWTYPPFEGRMAGGFIWGRGTLDDKMSVLGILEAVEKHLRDGYAPRRTIYLAFGHDEENGGNSGAAKIKELLQSRGVKLDYVLDEGMTITEGMVPNVTKPVALIGIAEKGCLNLELSVEGEGGHSMMPPAQTAIGIVSAAVSRLEQHQFPARMEAPARKMFETLSPEMPLGTRIVLSNLWLFEGPVKKKLASVPRTNALIRTTIAPTIFNAGVKENILATRARAVVNFRLLPGDTIEKIVLDLQKIINDTRVKIKILEGLKSEPSRVADTESKGYQAVQRTIGQVFPHVLVAPGMVMAVTDSRHYADLAKDILHFSPIRLRSEDMQRIHGRDERISIEDYREVVNFYSQLIKNEANR